MDLDDLIARGPLTLARTETGLTGFDGYAFYPRPEEFRFLLVAAVNRIGELQRDLAAEKESSEREAKEYSDLADTCESACDERDRLRAENTELSLQNKRHVNAWKALSTANDELRLQLRDMGTVERERDDLKATVERLERERDEIKSSVTQLNRELELAMSKEDWIHDQRRFEAATRIYVHLVDRYGLVGPHIETSVKAADALLAALQQPKGDQ